MVTLARRRVGLGRAGKGQGQMETNWRVGVLQMSSRNFGVDAAPHADDRIDRGGQVDLNGSGCFQ